MKKNNGHSEYFTVEQAPEVTLLHFLDQLEYRTGMLVEIVNELWSILSGTEKRSSKAVILYPPPGILSPEKFKKVMAAHGAACFNAIDNSQNRIERRNMEANFIRDINATHQLIKNIRGIDDFVVAAMSGQNVLSMFGPALACDLRLVTNDFVLVNRTPYSKFMASAGVPWFLSRIMGRAKAWALLASEQDINAKQALDLGLVDKIVSPEQLKETSITLAQTGAMRPWAVRIVLKQAMMYVDAPLEHYLDMEKSLFLSSIEQRAASFKDGV